MNTWERLAGHDPARPAVHSAEGVTTYGELAERVDRCAAVLSALGPAPGEVLAVEVDEGLPAVIALVAALRAEVPFAWLTPAYPPLRREQVVRDCRPAALLVWKAGRPAARRLGGRPGTVPADTGCVVYTSGSTGTPKGIVQPRAALDQFARWFAEELALAPGSRVLQWAAMTYDAAYAEVLAALHAGATLVVPSAEEKSDPARIAELVAEQRVSHLLTVPSLCRALFAARPDRPLPGVGSLGLFGEVLPPDLLVAAARHLPNAEVRNFYGPTECTLATWYRVPAGFTGEVVPVGRPVPGRDVLLDGTGVAEVLVRSRYLAHGYLGREEETAQRFLPDPGGDPAVRVYRTGDLGRYDADGELVFVGRLDDEVKIRGVRVRLGDVEAALSTAPGVAEVAVRLHGAGRVAPEIVAYVAARPGRRPDVTALRRHAVRALPPVMVPAHYVLLDDLPRTSTGKVDRAALPAPVPASPGGPPTGDLERELASIWQEVTGRAGIGVDDDFFGVGGHSLLAPRVVARVRARLGLAVPQRAVFDHSRFADFAAYLTTLRTPTEEQP
ncbi:non-ribosomal peptide synthetase [Saccharothrix sp. Mg75]|uniref:non-ribosomal peptide synthetase n=1 Tax=Saccharothrix sp. Mg75 TaxID=3445357 RepID=UPI003EE8B63B